MAWPVLGAGGIRPHSNAWDEYHINFKKCILFIISFSDFLPNCLSFSIPDFVV